ncbi:MAG TPA: epoxyqueuosine reductase [Candidatus Syntrophoarchaeum butanivorans]|uniref:4Fe-4S ferredoxin n=1 Tax=Candidatus Syntropharchaeum butanivorans TaxID=1839936 RepID=A0A1F2P6L1_9EURY|nr:MAG: 4Fe-4S ferredoxin [Candidatus Syntrophoarchaeum butanivorans]HEC57897.1 epoxyqueuosine reductase [Candidatus Syntrophoarchaeum butanivorans]
MADDLKQELINYGLSIGLDKIGVASAESVTYPPQQKDFAPSDFVSDAKSVISIAKAFPEGVLELDEEEDPYIFMTGFGPTYLTLEREVNLMGKRIVGFLKEKGYDAKLIEVNYPFDRKQQVGGAQLHQPCHKAIATQAGLGEEGIENLFLTPEFGPRILLASIVTNAPLEPDGPKLVNKVATDDKSGLEACPTSAISEDNYPPYNFNRNRCLWGIMGGVKATGLDEPPYDWTNAEDAMEKIDEYRSKYVKFDELLEWDEALGWFPKCVACANMCAVGKKEEE